MKSKLGEFYYKVRGVFLRRLRKELSGTSIICEEEVILEVSGWL